MPAAGVAAPLARPAASDGLIETDGELLRLFTRHGDAAAFDKLVERHAAMVWRVCRQTLRRQQDAEDAFQATFLLLVKGARQIGASESAAGWLFRVAYRTSLRARKRLASRREEALALDPTAPSEEQFPDLTARQHLGVLAEELMELPLRYQTPLVMRYVEGQSRRAIAEATDVTVATVQGRLARGKQLLRRRLVRRGVTLSVAISAVSTPKAQAARAAEAAASTQLVLQTTSNATALATGGSFAASAVVAALLEQGTRAMLFASLTKPMAAAAACGLAALVLAAPPAEPTATTKSDGVVLSAALADDNEGEPAEALSATLQLAANEPTSDREPEASAPGVAAQTGGGGAPSGSPRSAESTSPPTGASLTGAPPPPGDLTLRLGSKGPEVERLQKWLNGMIRQPAPNLVVDGNFNSTTEAALRRWQKIIQVEVTGSISAQSSDQLFNAWRSTVEGEPGASATGGEAAASKQAEWSSESSPPPTGASLSEALPPPDALMPDPREFKRSSIKPAPRILHAEVSGPWLMPPDAQWYADEVYSDPDRSASLTAALRGNRGANAESIWEAWVDRNPADEEREVRLIRILVSNREVGAARRTTPTTEAEPSPQDFQIGEIRGLIRKFGIDISPFMEFSDEELLNAWNSKEIASLPESERLHATMRAVFEKHAANMPPRQGEPGASATGGEATNSGKESQQSKTINELAAKLQQALEAFSDAAQLAYQQLEVATLAEGPTAEALYRDGAKSVAKAEAQQKAAADLIASYTAAIDLKDRAALEVILNYNRQFAFSKDLLQRALRLYHSGKSSNTDAASTGASLWGAPPPPGAPAFVPPENNTVRQPMSAEALERDPFGPRLSKEDATWTSEQMVAGPSLAQAAAAAVLLREQIAGVERAQAALRDQAETDAGIRQMVEQFDDVKAQMREQLERFDPRVGAEKLRSLTLPARQPEASTPTSTPLLPLDTSGRPGAYASANQRYGHSVQQLQQRLNEVLETSLKLDVDGDYGPQTTAAVRQFQSKQGLKPTGFADEETRRALGFMETASPPKSGVEALSSEIDKNLDEAEEALLELIAIAKRWAEIRESSLKPSQSSIAAITQSAIKKVARERYNTVTERASMARSIIKNATEDAVSSNVYQSSADPSDLAKSLAQYNAPLKRFEVIAQYAMEAHTSLQDPKAAPWLETFDVEKLRAGLMPPRPQESESVQESGRPSAPKSPPPAPPLPDEELSVEQLEKLQTAIERQRYELLQLAQSEGKLEALQAELKSKNFQSAEAKAMAELVKADATITDRIRQGRLLEAQRVAAHVQAALESVKPPAPPTNDGATQSILKQPDAPQAPLVPEPPKADAPPPPADEASLRSSSLNHLKEMMLALLNFHDQQQHFPGVVEGGLSWRVQLLPLLGYEGLYKEFHHDEPWDSPHNFALLKKMPDVYRDPRSKLPADSGKTNYVAAGGPGAFMALGEARRFTDIRDGTARTIALIEVGDDHAVEWTRPVDFDTEAHADDPRRGIGTLGPGGILVSFVDGSTRPIGEDVSSEALREMLLIDDASAKRSGAAKPSSYGGIALEPPKPDGSRIAYAARNKEYGWSVLQLQERLNEVLKPTPPLRVDGDYGPQTAAAVEQFQRDRELPVTGFADAATRAALGFVEPSEPKVSTPEPASDGKPASEAEPATDGEPGASATGGEAASKTASATAPELRPDVTEWFAQFKKKDASFKLTDEQILEVRTLLELDDPAMSEEKRLGREAGFALALGMPQFQNGSPSQRVKAATWFALQDLVDVEIKR